MKPFKLNRYEVDLEQITHYNQDLHFKTLSEMMRNSVERFAQRPLFGEKKDGSYKWMTFAEFGEKMLKMRAYLKQCGLEKGDRIAIIANNSIPFALTAYASYGLGAILVPMYEVQALEDWKYIFQDAQPKIAVVKSDEIRTKLESLELACLEKIIVIAPESGESMMECIEKMTPLDMADDVAIEDDVCDIIYTSGTTGRPHGVVLTHKNVAHNVKICASMFDYGCEDRVLSFLPWAHGFGKTVDFTLFPAMGAAVGLAESAKTIATNLGEVNPTVLCAVPKIFNRIYEQIQLKQESSRAVKFMFARAQKIMHKARTAKLNPIEKAEYRLMDKLVASKIRAVFGNALKFSVSGGASLSREIATFFEDFGIRVFEGYGMTEHAPVISINYNPDKIGSVGVALPTVKIEIEPMPELSDEHNQIGEIVISSDCVMQAYYHDPDGTAAVIDDQGRLHTGDTGYIDSEGFVYITGRVKEQYKLANGKYVVPTALEEMINNMPEIESSIIVGNGKPYNIVLIRPSEQCINNFYEKHPELRDKPIEDIEEHSDMRSVISQALNRACTDFRGYEKPQKFCVIMEEFTIQNGLLTPALKIKRRAVEKKYEDRISALY